MFPFLTGQATHREPNLEDRGIFLPHRPCFRVSPVERVKQGCSIGGFDTASWRFGGRGGRVGWIFPW